MLINRISISNFRNIKQADIEFGKQFNIFFGANGQGKTNILEAIFFLGTVKSFRHAKNIEMISWDQKLSVLKCLVTDDKLQHKLVVSIEPHKKQVTVDGKSPSRLVDYCNIVSVVVFSPEELVMVDGTPEQRRRYLDRAIFSSNPGYLKIYHDYFRVLKQRNQLLRSQNYSGLEAWTDQLVVTGTKLVIARSNYIEEQAGLFSHFYRTISASDEDGYLCYHPNSLSELNDPEEISAKLQLELLKNFRTERDRGTTINGPHRDDLGFFLNCKPISQHGSQGQKKSFVMAMKMAEIEYLQRKNGVSPILLLDDMTAELDKNRVKHLLDFLEKREMQVFITTTDTASVPITESNCSVFQIESGCLVK
jgi:DNA replication and repair protein RecF